MKLKIQIITDLFLQHMFDIRSVQAIAVLILRHRTGHQNYRPGSYDCPRKKRSWHRCGSVASSSWVYRAALVSETTDWILHRVPPENIREKKNKYIIIPFKNTAVSIFNFNRRESFEPERTDTQYVYYIDYRLHEYAGQIASVVWSIPRHYISRMTYDYYYYYSNRM